MNLFKLKEHNTNVKTEFTAGFTTFLTMMYIVPVNGFILADAGLPMDAVVTATALITILATIFSGLWANTPIAMSVGMGLNAYFSYGLVLGMNIPWQTALGIVFLSGVLFVLLSFTNFRVWIMTSIPMNLRRAISAGIGTFIAFIGLKQMAMIVPDKVTYVKLGDFSEPNVLIGALGLILAFIFYAYRLKGAFIFSIGITSIVAWFLEINPMPTSFLSAPASISPIFMQLDVVSALSLSLLPVIITFLITDMFDTLGTLTGIGARANMFQSGNKDDKSLQKTLEADAISTAAGSMIGVSTTTAFVESSTGVEEGGRTGLTAIFTAMFFITTLFMLPLFKSIPSNAIYPVLVVVGVLMFTELGKINFEQVDLATSAGAFFIVTLMPLTFSITNGIAAGFLAYTIIKLTKREFSDLNIGILTITLISLLVFILQG
ncbi:NCS2 family permease [Malaciobacter marinus]|jgi:AGZA family xanthine/uracil permease-like MFS transporter|uniref:Guanine permease n=1 Tax=Malaciobacter marinus TaxID=505249 RepID=A0A347TLX0_9BACT|nr:MULTISPECIES: NCS2 family permease [Malaciobacter]AXX87598.1 xanthine/uracil/vitamin C permease [Malaciobacter marinus]PHO14298.1 guanine permease [Malaciobacter marinus]RYA24855.1 NCS2 family permease [Malaciobacter halophilus]